MREKISNLSEAFGYYSRIASILGLLILVGIPGCICASRIHFSYESPSRASFSPDGEKIVIAGFERGKQNIYLINTDGTHPTRITNTKSNKDPIFSHDGSKIAFTNFELGSGGRKIYIINTDGSGLKRLTSIPMNQSKSMADDNFWENNPSFSPDDSKIVFTRGNPFGKLFGGSNNVFIINIDGTEERSIYSGYASAPYFSPDGKSILFSDKEKENKILLINVSKLESSINTIQNIEGVDPVFSADGKKISFCKVRFFRTPSGGGSKDSEIFIMNSDGSGCTQVTKTGSFKADPFFSPDGKKIYFFEIANNEYHMSQINIDGSNLQRIEIK